MFCTNATKISDALIIRLEEVHVVVILSDRVHSEQMENLVLPEAR